ncbi:hypothetical protein ACWDTG_21185 [Rhodococcus zopfii]|uniref:hypothetical protein n=1 Tax=Rhodococcus zopfii TaxID=43772 RepID=UPI0011114F55|nr:hypothetical protein [Rhodococcus zopfii]
MTEIAFATDFIADRTDRRPLRVAQAGFPVAHAPIAPIAAIDPAPSTSHATGLRAVVESAVGTVFSATVAAVMVTGLAGAGAASAVAGAAGALRSR